MKDCNTCQFNYTKSNRYPCNGCSDYTFDRWTPEGICPYCKQEYAKN